MGTAARYLKSLIRLCGAGALVLGLALWAGYARALLPLHLAFGLGLVLSLWAVAAIAWRTTTRPGLALLVALWGLGILVFGFEQGRLVLGSLHWIVAALHVVIGGIAIGLGGVLAGAMGRRREDESVPSLAWGRP